MEHLVWVVWVCTSEWLVWWLLKKIQYGFIRAVFFSIYPVILFLYTIPDTSHDLSLHLTAMDWLCKEG